MNKEDVINKKFPHAFWGYDAVEVDLFLDEVIREMDRLHNELEMASLGAEAARQREEMLKVRVEKLQRLLIEHGLADVVSAGSAAVDRDAAQDAEPDAELDAEKDPAQDAEKDAALLQAQDPNNG